MTWEMYAVGSAALLIIAFGVPAYFRMAVLDLRRYEQAAKHFMDKTDALASDPELPVGVLERLEFLASQISNPRAVNVLMSVLFSRDRKAIGRAEDYREVQAFFDKRPELHRAYGDAAACAMLAVFYNGSGLRGFLARLWLGTLIRRVDSEKAVEAIKSRSRDDVDHNDSGLAAAC